MFDRVVDDMQRLKRLDPVEHGVEQPLGHRAFGKTIQKLWELCVREPLSSQEPAGFPTTLVLPEHKVSYLTMNHRVLGYRLYRDGMKAGLDLLIEHPLDPNDVLLFGWYQQSLKTPPGGFWEPIRQLDISLTLTDLLEMVYPRILCRTAGHPRAAKQLSKMVSAMAIQRAEWALYITPKGLYLTGAHQRYLACWHAPRTQAA